MMFRLLSHCPVKAVFLMAILIVWVTVAARGQVIEQKPEVLQNIDVDEHLGGFVPLHATFVNDSGHEVSLAQYVDGKHPVILVMAYYTCPMLCNLILNGLSDALKQLDLTAGEDYLVLTISIDTTETWNLASAKKANYRKHLGNDLIADNWHFMVGNQQNISLVAKSIGFRYFYDEKQKQYAHPAVLTILSPQGNISRYLYGIEYKPRDLKFALMEAGQGKIGTTVDRLLLYCYHYDPKANGYVLMAAGIMRLGGLITVVLLATFLGIFWIRELLKYRRRFNVKVL